MRPPGVKWRLAVLLLLLGPFGTLAWLDDVLTFVDTPYVQPGCDVMFSPGAWCFPNPAPFVRSCCTPGFECLPDPFSLFGNSCQQLPTAALNYTFESTYGRCDKRVIPGGQCGGGGGSCKQFGNCGNTGPWLGFCCPDGFNCAPQGQDYRVWTCQADVSDRLPIAEEKELLEYPPRKLPPKACTCRLDGNGERVPTECPSPWAHAAGTSQVPPPIRVGPDGQFVSSDTGAPVAVRGVNWFGWNVGAYNFDGLWAYCDDNYTASDPPCKQDGDIPPHFPSPAIGPEGVKALGGISFWGKRQMTNDFATVVYRMKLLGFNAVRVPFNFASLNDDLPGPSSGSKSEFFPCMRDDDAYIAFKTLDPALQRRVARKGGRFVAPGYQGPQHPPPPDPSNPTCNLPWEAPFAPPYNRTGSLRLTQCNWYLPQGPSVPAIQRFLWQVQYMVSQGLYVVLSFHSRRDPEPNVQRPQLFARNWHNLWRAISDLPQYKQLLQGRVLADLANEPSRWGCNWDKPCDLGGGGGGGSSSGGQAGNQTGGGPAGPSCAPGVWLYAAAASGVHAVDPDVPVLVEGMGQDVQSGKYVQCMAAGGYPGMIWGEGFVTNGPTVARYSVSNPSGLFALDDFKRLGPLPITIFKPAVPNAMVVSPHLYPGSIASGAAAIDRDESALNWKWDLSWGWKALGQDKTATGEPLRRTALLIGEFGVRDDGDNSVNNTDATVISPTDRAWLSFLAGYLRRLSWQRSGGAVSWMWWAWNANSGDTKGIVGPVTTWREIQWTKIRMLMREFGLTPWYCAGVSPDFCATVTW